MASRGAVSRSGCLRAARGHGAATPWWLALLCVWLVWTASTGASPGQLPGLPAGDGTNDAEVVVEPEPEPVIVLPFSLAEAPERLADHRQNLNVTLQLVDDLTVSERISRKMAPIASDLRVMRRQLIRIDRLNPVQLRSVRDRSRYHARTVSEFQRRMNRRLSALEEQRAGINETLTRWTRTEEVIGEEDLPQTLAESLASYRVEAANALERIRGAIDEALAVQHRCQTVVQGFDSIAERIDQAAAQQLRGMFSADQSPLWHGAALHAAPAGVDTVATHVDNVVTELRSFGTEFRSNLITHGLATLLMIGLLIHFRRRLHQSPDAPRMANGVASILERPISSAVLVMILGTSWFYPYLPPSVNYLSSAVVSLPLLRLLPRLVPGNVRVAIMLFIVLGLVDSLAIIVLGQTFVGRLVQASLMLPLAAVAAWGGRQAVQAALRTKPRAVVLIRGVVWPTVMMFVGCSIATLVGYLQLATFFYNLAFTAALSGLLYFALIKVLSGGLVMLLQSRAARLLVSVQQNQIRLLRSGLKLIKTAGVLAWLATVLNEASLLPGVINGISSALGFTFGAGNLEVSLGRVLAFALTLWIALYLARIITALLDNDMLPRMELGRGVAGAVSKLTQYVILSIGALFALAAAGLELQNLALLATAFSIGLGFGLQNLVNNFVSGLILIFERPVQSGDVVEVSGKMGEVRRIGIRSSTVRLFDGAELVVPNGNLISNDLINWTLSDKFRRIEINVGVAYGTDLRKAKQVLEGVATSHPDISDTPAPSAFFMEFGDNSIDFALRCWTVHSDRAFGIRSELGLRVDEALAQAGIAIPFPQRDLHLKSGDWSSLPAPSASAPEPPLQSDPPGPSPAPAPGPASADADADARQRFAPPDNDSHDDQDDGSPGR